MKKIITILVSVLLNACVTETPYTVKKIEPEFTHINPKGRVGDKVVGLNDKKEVILREESDVADELRVQQMVNIRLRDDLGYEAYQLKTCRIKLSRPDMGGDGKMPELYETEKVKGEIKVKETMGIDGKEEIKIVKETYLLDELKNERRLTETLKSTLELVVKHKEECEYKLDIVSRKKAEKMEVSNEN